MTWFLILLALLAVTTTVLVVLVVTIHRDGRGTRVPPGSHRAWSDDVQNLPSRPY